MKEKVHNIHVKKAYMVWSFLDTCVDVPKTIRDQLVK